MSQEQVAITRRLQQVVGGAAEQSLHGPRVAECAGDQHIGVGLPRGGAEASAPADARLAEHTDILDAMEL